MKRILLSLFCLFLAIGAFSQSCQVTGAPVNDTIVCGDYVSLSAFGRGQGIAVFSEDFNTGGYGPGWAATTQAMFNNPCGPNTVDGTTYIWMGNSSPVPRILTTASFNLSSCANAGVTICFDMRYAVQGENAPCEGPDLPAEGVYLQYSIDNGATWVTIHYTDPNGGYDPQLTTWNNYCFLVPTAALTNNTKFRWYQDNDSGADYDHWGIDNVVIYCNDPSYNIVWQHDGYNSGATGGVDPTPVHPHTSTDYIVTMSNGTTTCRDTVHLIVRNPTVVIDAGNDTSVCTGSCAQLHATAKVVKSPAKTPTYTDAEQATVTGTPGLPGFPPFIPPTPGIAQLSMGINVTGLNSTTVQNGLITSVCIGSLSMFPGNTITIFQVWLVCPSGDSILLVPDSTLTGTDMTNTCFVPAGSNINSASSPYTGSYSPSQPFSGLNGCSSNGQWSLHFLAVYNGFTLPVGFFNSWSISFNDPEISYTGNFNWSPTVGMTASNTLSPTVCPPFASAYTIIMSDTAGCVTSSDSVHVTTHTCCSFGIASTVTQPTCNQNNGSINLTINPPAAYTFAWSSGPTTQNLSNIPAGTYTVTITGPGNCTKDTTITLTSANGPTISNITSTPQACGLNNGTATVTATGGTGNLGYSWSNSQTTSAITGLAPNTYSVTVTDAASCTVSASVTVAAGAGPTISNITSTAETCLGQHDGTATVTAGGGTGNLIYAWSNSQSTASITGLMPNTYSVTVTDASSCTVSASVTVAAGPNCCNIGLSVIATQPTCGASNGSITLNVQPNGNYSYTWSDGGSGATRNNLSAGALNVTITDNNTLNCTKDTTINLNSNSSLSLTASNPVNPTCANNDGQLTVALSGGTAPYTVTIDTGGTPQTIQVPIAITQTLTNLPAGTVNVSVTDAGGCQASATATLTLPANCCRFSVSANIGQPACGQSNGSVTLTTTNGSGNYSYSWSSGLGSSNSVNNIGAGNYNVTITDNAYANCFIDTSFALANPGAPVIDSVVITDETCMGLNNGTASIYASGGTGTLTYAWMGGQTTASLNSLAPGNYPFTVTDATSCAASGSATIAAGPDCCPLRTSASVVPPSCNQNNASVTVNITVQGTAPYTYSIDGTNYQNSNLFSNVPSGTYSVITADATSCHDTISATVPQVSSNLNVTATSTNITCFGANDGTATSVPAGGNTPYAYLWSNTSTLDALTGLSAGTYSVTVTDQTGCSGTASADVTEPAPVSVNLGNDVSVCEGQTVLLDAGPGYAAYSWSSSELTQTINPIVSGLYSVTVSDINGCSASDDVSVTIVPAPVIDLGDDKLLYEGQYAVINAIITGGVQSATYNWQPDTLLSCSGCLSPTVFAAHNITYTLSYSDQFGCSAHDSINIVVLPVGEIYWPNAFTPNGDGNNDVFLPYGAGVKQINWTIFNRWGEKVYDSDNFFEGWDGTYKHEPLPMSVYVYHAKVVMMNNTTNEYKGSVTLIR